MLRYRSIEFIGKCKFLAFPYTCCRPHHSTKWIDIYSLTSRKWRSADSHCCNREYRSSPLHSMWYCIHDFERLELNFSSFSQLKNLIVPLTQRSSFRIRLTKVGRFIGVNEILFCRWLQPQYLWHETDTVIPRYYLGCSVKTIT